MEKRRNFKLVGKAKIIFKVLREEKTLTEIAAEYEGTSKLTAPMGSRISQKCIKSIQQGRERSRKGQAVL